MGRQPKRLAASGAAVETLKREPEPTRRKGTPTRSSRRREEIIAISAAMFAEKGFVGTTIRDIAERADILSGSLYHHFASKESIVDEIMQNYWHELLRGYENVLSTDAEPNVQLIRLLDVSLSLFESMEYAVRILLNDFNYLVEFLPYIEQNMSAIEEVWVTVIRKGMNEGTFRADTDPTIVYRTIMSAVSGTGRWYRFNGDIQFSDVRDSIESLILRGLLVTRD